MVLNETDLTVAPGGFFGHERAYNNQTSSSYIGPNGWNWFVKQMPYIVASGSSIAVVFDPNNPYWFDASGSSFTPRYGMIDVSLTQDTTAHTVTFTTTFNGQLQVAVFNSLTATTAPGGLVSYTDANGLTSSVTSRSGSSITEIQRSYTLGGVSIVDSLQYAYFASGSASGLLQTATYRQQIGGGSWTPIKQVTYGYYGASDANGSVNDLQSATQQLPNGTGGWNPIAVDYYRYWLSGSSTGFAHALKMHFGPEAYRLIYNAGLNIETASDSTVLPYADHYYEYSPSTQQVSKEISAVCPSCVGGGTTSDTFTYTPNPSSPTPGYNVWAMKTVQTLPDSSTITVYTNYIGKPMLYVQTDPSGTNQWITFYRYDANGNLIWTALPSAVNGYDDSYNDLLNYDSGTGLYEYLNDSTGLIKVTDYSSSTGSGAVAGYPSDNKVQEGQSGTPVLLKSMTYTSNTDSDGNTIYPLAAEVVYPNASNTSITITTSYAYTYYSGTNQVQQKTVTLPAISSGQNGDGTTPTRVSQFDSTGNLTQYTDERGIVNTYSYGILGLLSEQVLNYQSGVTEPGVNVTTDYTYDSQGRLIQTLGPSHTVVLSGTATTVRRATWNVYLPSTEPTSGTWGVDQTWTGTGYATGSGPSYTYTLVDPVTINNTDKDGRSTDVITSHRSSGSGPLSPTDTFNQTDWQTWSRTQYDDQHRTTSRRTYFLIPSSGTGTAGTNYGETDYGYDALERRNRVVAPGGTITRTVWQTPQQIASVWVGTNDTGATDSNPAGSGSPNNMVKVTANQWDGGSAGGDHNLTQQTQYTSSTATRVTSFGYDWRDRQTSMTDALSGYTIYTYDNLDRLTETQRYASSGGNLIAQNATSYDDRNRVYQRIIYAVDPSTGTVGNSLIGNSWYDYSGNLIQRINPGDGQRFVKSTYNGVGRITATYVGYNTSGTSYSQATTVANDIILEQSQNTYDEVGNLVSQAAFQRLNDATGSGALGYASGAYPSSVAAYPFAEGSGTTTADASGNGNSGTLGSGITWGTSGPTGHCLTFSAAGPVSVADAASLELTGDLTLAAWINPTDFAGYRGVLSKTNSNIAAPYDLYLVSGTGIPALVVGDGTSYQGFTASSAPAAGTWSHLAVTISGTTVTFYLNGVAAGGGTITVSRGDAGHPLQIGQREDGGTSWNGSLTEVRLYNRALAAAEIAALYNLDPSARVSYTAAWFDGVDRNIASANYGAIASFTRPDTPPSSSSTVLVTSISYDNAGQPSQVTDAMGYMTQNTYDNAGRKTQMIEDYGSGLLNRTTNWTYTLDNLVATMTAVNATTGNQTTTYTYGTTLSTSGVARNDLLASVTYPDSVSGSDVVSYTYNTLGQQVTVTDQRGTVRTFYYDKLGRLTDDGVSMVGSDTDNAVLRINTTYEVRGMVATVTSYDNATPGSGTALNQCALTYNSFAQLTEEQQDHNGTVSGSSPKVQYSYDSGSSSNEIRLNGLTYPNGRVITCSYGTSGGINDLLNRIDTIQDTTSGTTDLASYTYLGLGTVIRITYDQPSVWLDLWGGTSGTFAGLDLFNRVIDQRWQNSITGTPTDIDRYQYGYDQNSNRLYKANVVGTPIVSGGLDEYYTYDHLNRLSDMQRGTLNSGKTDISGTPTIEQTWSLDPTGNWSGFITKASGTTNLNQTRTSNTVNEITNITESTGPSWIVPAYDAAGNTTTMPQVTGPTQSFTTVYDAWNRMVSISASGSLVAQYQYDGQNRRAVKLTYSGGSLSETRHFYFTNAWQDVEERVGTSTSMDKQYLWGMRYVDELVCRDDATPERLYACQDANFNLTAITDSSGAVEERYLFDPYGNRIIMNASWSVITSSSYGWVTGHQGLMHDSGSGMIYNRYNDLHSYLGRWLRRDPAGYVGGTNEYLYLFSNPLRFVDPMGLLGWPKDCCDVLGAPAINRAKDLATNLIKRIRRYWGAPDSGHWGVINGNCGALRRAMDLIKACVGPRTPLAEQALQNADPVLLTALSLCDDPRTGPPAPQPAPKPPQIFPPGFHPRWFIPIQ